MRKIIDFILAHFKQEEVSLELLEATYGKKNAQKIVNTQVKVNI